MACGIIFLFFLYNLGVSENGAREKLDKFESMYV